MSQLHRRPCITVSILLAAHLSTACGGETTRAVPFDAEVARVIGQKSAPERSAFVDVYVDATTSMQGYAHAGSIYGSFLDALDRSITVGWPSATVQFYRFGSRVDSIGRDVFRTARTEPGFYRVRGLYERTNIDSVLMRADLDRVSVIVTDLFQSDGDVNLLVDQIMRRAFVRGLDVALLAVPSEFNGVVYDAPGGSYRYQSTPGDATTNRPFYALMIGSSGNLQRLFQTLQAHPSVSPDRFLLISPFLVDSFSVRMSTRELNAASVTGPNTFRFNLRPGSTGGAFTAVVAIMPGRSAPLVVSDRIELTTQRRQLGKSGWSSDTVSAQDFKLQSIRRSHDTLFADIHFSLGAAAGTYGYRLSFRTAQVSGLRAPAWIREWSSESPSAAVDANKTLNLESLVDGLIQGHSTTRPPMLAEAVVTIHKP